MVRFDVSTENGTLDLFQERFHESFDSIIELVVPKNLKKKTRNEELGDKERTDQQKLVVTQNTPPTKLTLCPSVSSGLDHCNCLHITHGHEAVHSPTKTTEPSQTLLSYEKPSLTFEPVLVI